jgi:hypothetical protein
VNLKRREVRPPLVLVVVVPPVVVPPEVLVPPVVEFEVVPDVVPVPDKTLALTRAVKVNKTLFGLLNRIV